MRLGPDADAVRAQIRMFSYALAAGVVILAVVIGLTGVGAAAEPTTLETPIRITVIMAAAFLLAGARALTVRIATVLPGTDPHVAASSLLTGVLAGQGVRELIGLAGGLIGFLAGDLAFMAVLAAASALTIVIAVPGQDEVRRRIEGPRS
ncbi:MAG: hypothetical protein KJP18_15235 [Gemmatimonadetes bacterium]|nr:hypothetical protein [Gemmatimonadota bacterium]NNF37595.1 hypothetical protein [Gemmatimonadota bacterium]NNK65034.1 hypothetical protein [Gemmatimonadota bacterium]